MRKRDDEMQATGECFAEAWQMTFAEDAAEKTQKCIAAHHESRAKSQFVELGRVQSFLNDETHKKWAEIAEAEPDLEKVFITFASNNLIEASKDEKETELKRLDTVY